MINDTMHSDYKKVVNVGSELIFQAVVYTLLIEEDSQNYGIGRNVKVV